MQESFTIRAKKAVRKIAAIGTGLGMVGATMMSAVALDYTLGDYPKPFIMNKKFSNVAAIIGETSSPDDNTALLDVLSGLEQATAVSKPGSSGPASGGAQKTEDLQVGKALNNTADGFGTSIDSTDVDGFQDTSVRIDIDDVSDDYQVKDGIRFGNACANQASLLANSGFESPILQTALSFDRDEDWQDKVFITFSKQSVCYRYTFDSALSSGNTLTSAKSTDPIAINFLGQELEIQNATNTSMVVNSGERFDLKAGDNVQVEGKTVTLISATSSNKVRIDVDGTSKVITEDSEQIINGLEIRAEDVSDDQGIEFDAATLFIGLSARDTFKDGEEYIGEDQDNPVWVWQLSNLGGSSPVIGVKLDLSLDSPDETDNPAYQHPLYETESLCLPRDYACIIFDSMAEDDFLKYSVDSGVTESLFWNQSLADANSGAFTKKVLEISAGGAQDNGFQLGDYGGIASDDRNKDTDTIMFALFNGTTDGGALGYTLGLFREEQDGSDAIWFANLSHVGAGQNITHRAFFLDYKDSLIPITVNITSSSSGSSGTTGINGTIIGNFIIDLSTGNDGTDPAHGTDNNNLTIWFRGKSNTDPNSITYLGNGDGTEDTYLFYGSNDISAHSEDTRTPTGLKLYDPASGRSGDKFEFELPADITDYKANIVVTTSGKKVSTDSGNVVTDEAPQIQKADEVTDLTQFNAILGGGPCVNSHVARIKNLSPGSCGVASGFTPNEAVIELVDNGSNVALVVAGWEADDTKRAGVVLKNYDDTKVMTAFGSKTSVVVKGTTMDLSSIEVA
ncbi:hypothetical protein J4455_04260 [Candidatus Woesearchaeota archaeon]|nr:hypothetical protein [Candidatus Woesearchaeota archaeon]